MIKQLRKVGNRNALILDEPILELLGLEENGEVEVLTMGVAAGTTGEDAVVAIFMEHVVPDQ